MIGSKRTFAATLLKWYWASRRDLPWRPPVSASADVRPDAYYVLLSELMLQQTQVATVVPYFHRFLAEFPTLARLAAGDEQQVLRLWQGLGYYARARNLHRTAQLIVARHGGTIPADIEALLALPGIGRYTAGAVASAAYNTRAPILDCNVQRVLCRLDAVMEDPRARITSASLWLRAEELLPRQHVGDFNSALMELGATLCASRAPKCAECPVRRYCDAKKQGVQEQIPPPKAKLQRPLEQRWVFCIGQEDRWLIEQRPANGRWAGMWQFVTVPRGDGQPDATAASALTGTPVGALERLGAIEQALTHRRYQFEIWRCASNARASGRGRGKSSPQRAWATLAGLAQYPMPTPHVRIAALLRAILDATPALL